MGVSSTVPAAVPVYRGATYGFYGSSSRCARDPDRDVTSSQREGGGAAMCGCLQPARVRPVHSASARCDAANTPRAHPRKTARAATRGVRGMRVTSVSGRGFAQLRLQADERSCRDVSIRGGQGGSRQRPRSPAGRCGRRGGGTCRRLSTAEPHVDRSNCRETKLSGVQAQRSATSGQRVQKHAIDLRAPRTGG